MPISKLRCALVVSPFLACGLTAQQVWQVAVGADVQAVVDGAAPGDIIQLAPGNHTKFTLTKSLTVVGPATLGFTFNALDLVIALPPNDIARFVDLTITTDIAIPGFVAYGNVQVQSGTVVFDGCTITGTKDNAGSIDVQGANAVFRHCDVTGFSPGGGEAVTAHDGNIVATDSTFTGADSGLAGAASRAITATGTGALHLSACTAQGGSTTAAIVPVNPAEAILSDVDTWIVDSTLSGGDSNLAPGAVALQALNARVARTSLSGGLGMPPGAPSSGTVVTDDGMLGASSTPVHMSPGLPATFAWTADGPGVLIAVLLSVNAPKPPIVFQPLIAQPLWATQMSFAGSFTTDGTGTAALSFTVPNRATLSNQSFSLFGVAIDGATVQVAPVISMVVR